MFIFKNLYGESSRWEMVGFEQSITLLWRLIGSAALMVEFDDSVYFLSYFREGRREATVKNHTG